MIVCLFFSFLLSCSALFNGKFSLRKADYKYCILPPIRRNEQNTDAVLTLQCYVQAVSFLFWHYSSSLTNIKTYGCVLITTVRLCCSILPLGESLQAPKQFAIMTVSHKRENMSVLKCLSQTQC